MSDNNKPKKKWYKRKWAFVLYFFLFVVIVAAAGDDEQSSTTQVVNTEPIVQQEIVQETTEANQVSNQEPVTKTEEPAQPPAQKVAEPEPVKEAPKPQVQEKSYQQVFTFSGNGAKKSEPFTITGSRFKIKYDCNGDLCQAFLHNTRSDFDLELIMNSTESVADETILYGSGEYYIEANTIGSYTMTVEDYR
ncbi:MAG: hypothetical protein ACPGO5_03300 [Patescibacteria group bacterium]